jgi:phosphatidylinositol glycan class W
MILTASNSSSAIKERKEAFVTGHSGTTISEIILICASSPAGIGFYFLLLHIICSSSTATNTNTTVFFKRRFKILGPIVLEFLVILLPMIVGQTKFLYPFGITILLGELLSTVLLLHSRWGNPQQPLRTSSGAGSTIPNSNPIKKTAVVPFVTLYRSSMYIHTFIAILAVDFHVFPRTLAKTETVGYGFMDLGASSFVISSGLVASLQTKTKSSRAISTTATTTTLPLLVLGLLRIITNKSADYQEHVSEYGIHWNFFFTLAVTRTITALVKPSCIIVPWILLLMYQVLLSVYHVQEYVETASRIICPIPTTLGVINNSVVCSFFAANREGILGCISYGCLHCISRSIGCFCLAYGPSQWKRLSFCTLMLWMLHFCFTGLLNIPVSRRSTNLTFITWSLAHNVTMLLLFWIVADPFIPSPDKIPPILSAVNRHGFILFVISNLLTGAVNLSINTLEVVDDWIALFILISYIACIALIALLLDNITGTAEKDNSSPKTIRS